MNWQHWVIRSEFPERGAIASIPYPHVYIAKRAIELLFLLNEDSWQEHCH